MAEERIPPRAIESEMAALGAALLDAVACDLFAQRLSPEVFYKPAHSTIAAIILGLYGRNRKLDHVEVSEELERQGKFETIGGASYIVTLMNSVPACSHQEQYIDRVLKAYAARQAIIRFGEWQSSLYGGSDVAEVLDGAEAEIWRLARQYIGTEAVHISKVLPGVLDAMEHKATHPGIYGIPSGFIELDEATGGWKPGDFIVIGGKTASGKTTLALTFALHALRNGTGVLFFTLEMSAQQCVQRLICSDARVSATALRDGKLKTESDDWQRVNESAAKLSSFPISFVDSPDARLLSMRAITRREKRASKIGLVIVDYLQLIPVRRRESRVQEVTDITRGLKSLARDCGIPVMALSQFHRESEKEGRSPRLSDFRESGTIEQDADVAILIDRDTESTDPVARADTTLILAKNRHGDAGHRLRVSFLPEYISFEPQAKQRDREREPYVPTKCPSYSDMGWGDD